jgi:MFS family permease
MDWTPLRALRHRNYRLYIAGQAVSFIGTWMQQLAMSWLVFRLTRSPFILGLVGFAAQVPVVFLAPFAGVLIDRWNQYRTLLVTQSLAMVQAALLAGLVLSDSATVGWIVALSTFLGIVNVFDMTTRQAFLTTLVPDKEDLANAVALNSSIVNGARLVGPALAGVTIAAVGEGICFLLNAISYVAVLIALLAMVVPPARPRRRTRVVEGLREGLVYTFGFRPIRSLLLLLALVSFAGLPYTVLLPVFATDMLGGGPDTLGLLTAASGVGALIGALYLATRKTVLGLGKRIAAAPMVMGVALMLFAYSRSIGLSMLFLLVAGFAMMVQMAATNTMLQTVVEEDKRGRVMSFYALAFLGMTPLGSVIAGWLADANMLGAPLTVTLGGVLCIGGGILFTLQLEALRERIRPIYRELGILPQCAAGVQAASELSLPPETR